MDIIVNRLEKTRAFLTEFIIVILFFTISAVITVQLFVEANKKSSKSMNTTESYIMAENIVENIKASLNSGGMEAVDGYITDSENYIKNSEGKYYQYYDKKLEVADEDDAYIIGKVVVSRREKDGGTMYSITVSFEDSTEIFCNIETKMYIGEEK